MSVLHAILWVNELDGEKRNNSLWYIYSFKLGLFGHSLMLSTP